MRLVGLVEQQARRERRGRLGCALKKCGDLWRGLRGGGLGQGECARRCCDGCARRGCRACRRHGLLALKNALLLGGKKRGLRCGLLALGLLPQVGQR